MKALVLLMGLAVANPAWAQERPPLVTASGERGWLTGVSIGLIGLGVAGLVLGGASAVTAGEIDRLIVGYGTLSQAEAATAKVLLDRRDAASAIAVPLLISGGVLLAGGVLGVLLDSMWSK